MQKWLDKKKLIIFCCCNFKDEIDELDLILEKNDENSLLDIISYNFEICDMLLNVAPLGHSIIGESVGDYSEFDSDSYHIDLVSASGHSKHGAISVLQRSIRPEVIASFQIPDVLDMWSVFSDSPETFPAAPTFLFLTKIDSTTILQMANEITELEREASRFCTRSPTLCCANLCNNNFILQITPNSCFLYSDCSSETGATLIFNCDLLPKLDSSIKQATVVDPYIAILTEKGTFLLLIFNDETVTLDFVEPMQIDNLSCYALYRDDFGVLSPLYGEERLSEATSEPEKPANKFIKKPFEETLVKSGKMVAEEMNIDDEDELLYGSKNDIYSSSDPATYINKILTDTTQPPATKTTIDETNEEMPDEPHSQDNTFKVFPFYMPLIQSVNAFFVRLSINHSGANQNELIS